MKVPVAMIRDYVDTALTAHEIGDLLTMAGFELEEIFAAGSDHVLDIKVMSNRGDGLSVIGLSREILAKSADARPTALYLRAVDRFRDVPVGPDPNPIEIRVEAEACDRFATTAISGVFNALSPDWMQHRLDQAGMRPISLLVDLSNYVMLETGQPLHAFDRAKLGDAIVVREARPDERLTTLNGVTHELRPGQMMICDAARPVGVAGVMGGLDTEVDGNTTDCVLESAHFASASIRRTRQQLGLFTEASYRFERSVDPEGVTSAARRFVELLRSLQPNVTVAQIGDWYPAPRSIAAIQLRLDRAARRLGMQIRHEEAARYLTALGFEVAGHGDPYMVVPPTWRPDIVREDDLVEELGRIHGYERIPEALPAGTVTGGGLYGADLQRLRLAEAMARLGFIQTVSHSLRDRHALDTAGDRVGPRNPGSPETAFLRNSLLPGLAEAMVRNGSRDLHLFESGHVFAPGLENAQLAAISTGALWPVSRTGDAAQSADFYSLKGILDELLASVGLDARLSSAGVSDARFHPGRLAGIEVNGVNVGQIGQLHPSIAQASDLPAETYAFELSLTALGDLEGALHLRSISRNPAVRRDIALLIDQSVPYSQIESVVAEAAGEVLERQWLFDVFTGTGIPEGKHSLGIGIQLRKSGENFTDEEANRVRERVVAALAGLGGTTR